MKDGGGCMMETFLIIGSRSCFHFVISLRELYENVTS